MGNGPPAGRQGGPPQQFPRISMPGAEYLSLAPNRTIDISGRRVRGFSATASIGAASTGSLSPGGVIETNFQYSSGIYIHDLWLNHDPTTGFSQIAVQGLQIGFSFSATPGTPVYRVAATPLTLANPLTATTLVSDRDKLILGSDVLALGPAGTSLMFSALVSLNNTAGGAVSPVESLFIVYSRLDGVVT